MSVRSSLLWASAASYISAVLSLGAMLIVSRLLSPQEFGIYAIALGAINLLNVLREGGVGAYIIQHETAGLSILRAAFTATGALSLFCAGALCALAPVVGVFYEAPELTGLLYIGALNALLLPFSIVVTAELERAMRFRAVFWLQFLSTSIGSFFTVAFVAGGLGVYGLALGTTAATLVNVGYCLWVVEGYGRFYPTLVGVRSVFRFSAAAAAALVLRQIDRDALALVVGRVLGPTPVGYANRGGALLNIYERLTAGLYAVIFPAFAGLRRRGEDMAPALLNGLNLITMATLLVFGFLAIVPEPALVFLFGEQWRPAAPLVPPLAAVALIGLALERMATPVYLAHGRVDLPVKINAILLVVKVGILIIAAPFSLEAAVWALLIYAVVALALDFIFLPPVACVRRRDLAAVLVRNVLIAAPVVLVGGMMDAAAQALKLGAFLHLVLVGVPFSLVAVLTLFVTRHPLAGEIARLVSDAKARLSNQRREIKADHVQ